MRQDQRKVEDLWVINALANPRPRLETYKYGMPGEENQPQTELVVFDLAAKKGTKLPTDLFKDQQLGLVTAPPTNLQREKQDTAPRWVTMTGDQIYFTRTSRDLKRIDIVEPGRRDGRAARRRAGAVEHLHRDPAAAPARRRQGADRVVGARRLGPLLPVRRGRQDEAADHVRRVRRHGHRVGRREDAHALLQRRGPRGRRGSVLHAPLPREHRLGRRQAAQSRQRVARGGHERQEHVLRRQLVAHQLRARVRALRRDGHQDHGPREDGHLRPDGGRLQVSRGVHGQGRRRHHRSLRDDVQAVRLRSGEEVSRSSSTSTRGRRPSR